MRGAELLAQRPGIDIRARAELVQIYERWDGRGFSGRLRAEAISTVARIVQLAEAARMFAAVDDADTAVAMLRRGSAEPHVAALADALCS